MTRVSVDAGKIDVSTETVATWGSVCVIEMYKLVVSVKAGKKAVSVACWISCNGVSQHHTAFAKRKGKEDVPLKYRW